MPVFYLINVPTATPKLNTANNNEIANSSNLFILLTKLKATAVKIILRKRKK
jgi:hypothetical protein